MKSAMSRRGFIRSGAIAGAVAGTLPALGSSLITAAGGASKDPVRLGVCSYSFHKFDRAHVIDFVHQLKTPWLNAKDISDHLPSTSEAAEDKAVADYKAAGIELTSAGVIYFAKPDEADIRAKFEYAKRAGVRVIVGSPTKEVLPMMEPFVKQYDMRLAIHNHGPEDKEWPSPLDILAAISSMDKRIGLCMDMGHTARALNGSAVAVVDAIHKAEARLFDVHIKDLADLTKKESQVAVGEGKMPIRGIFEALVAVGYKGYVDLEYEIHEDDPLPGMMKSFAFMRKVLVEMGQR
jgi:sugar phosphate isomerase/epimerase